MAPVAFPRLPGLGPYPARSDASAARTAGVVGSAGVGDDGGVAFKTCQSCEQVIPKGARYCPVCGTELEPRLLDVPLSSGWVEPLDAGEIAAVTIGLLCAIVVLLFFALGNLAGF